MASNIKGWIGFLVIAVIIIGGAFGTNHLLPSKASGTTITGITSNAASGFYNASNQSYTVNVSDSTSNVTFAVSILATIPSGAINITVEAPSLQNLSAYNSTFDRIYNITYNQTKNATLQSGATLNSSVNKSIAENATRLAETYTNQNITFHLFQSFTKNTQYTGGKYTFNFTAQLNATALKLMSKGQILFVTINAATGPTSANGNIFFVKT